MNSLASLETSNVASGGAPACSAATPSAAPTDAFLVSTSTLYGSAALAVQVTAKVRANVSSSTIPHRAPRPRDRASRSERLASL